MLQEINMLSSEFTPLAEYLLVRTENTSNIEQSKSGIILTTKKSVMQRPCSGTVLACGKDCLDLKKGDYVVYPDTDGIDVKFLDSDLTKEHEFALLRYKSIIGKRGK